MCLSERSNSVVSPGYLPLSVAVQKHCAANEPSAIPRAFPCLFDGRCDDRKRVSATKKLKIKVDTELQRFIGDDLQQGSVALFALSRNPGKIGAEVGCADDAPSSDFRYCTIHASEVFLVEIVAPTNRLNVTKSIDSSLTLAAFFTEKDFFLFKILQKRHCLAGYPKLSVVRISLRVVKPSD